MTVLGINLEENFEGWNPTVRLVKQGKVMRLSSGDLTAPAERIGSLALLRKIEPKKIYLQNVSQRGSEKLTFKVFDYDFFGNDSFFDCTVNVTAQALRENRFIITCVEEDDNDVDAATWVKFLLMPIDELKASPIQRR